MAAGEGAGFETRRKRTRRDEFFDTMNAIVPLTELCTVIWMLRARTPWPHQSGRDRAERSAHARAPGHAVRYLVWLFAKLPIAATADDYAALLVAGLRDDSPRIATGAKHSTTTRNPACAR